MSKQISLGAFTVTEARLRPDARPDALILTNDSVTFQITTFELLAEDIEALTDIVRDGRMVALALEDFDGE